MIRTATPADRPAVGALQQLLDEPAPALLDAAFDAGSGLDADPGSDPHRRLDAGSAANGGVASVLVAERDGTSRSGAGLAGRSTSTAPDGASSVVGYALAVPGAAAGATAGPKDAVADRSVAYLAELVVAPGWRRRGVGSELVAGLCERLVASDQLRVTARADDHGARAFYRDQGFRAVADLPGHYGGEDASAGGGEDESTSGRDGVLLVRDLE